MTHLEVRNTNRMPCAGNDDSQVREYLRTWSINWLTVKRMAFQVHMV